MKISKKLLSLLLCAIMVLGSVAVGGEGFADVLDAFSVKASAASLISESTYTVTYNANGGSGVPSSQTKNANESLTLSTTIPTRTGYTFLGWSSSSSASSPSYYPGDTYSSNSSITFYAVWQSAASLSSGSTNSASINFGGQIRYYKFTPSSSGTYVIYSTGGSDTKVQLLNSSGSEISSNDDGGDNSNFRLEYNLSSGSTYYYGVKYYSSTSTGTISFKFGPVYTISYSANGGSGAPSSQKKDWGKSITLSSTEPTYNTNIFEGWSTSSSAASASYQPGDSFSSNDNYTLYAVWVLVYTGGTVVDTTKPTGSISSTNNVASSQTVTLSLFDNAGVAGYYWGTSSTYSNNTYSATSSSSVTKTISSAGTYYLTVKDTSGNVSSNYSITFYKTTLNANGGSVSPTSVLTKSGNSFTFPTPTKSGYTYSGWSTSSSATSGVKSLTPSSSTTYYAVWKSSPSTGSCLIYQVNAGYADIIGFADHGQASLTIPDKINGYNVRIGSLVPLAVSYTTDTRITELTDEIKSKASENNTVKTIYVSSAAYSRDVSVNNVSNGSAKYVIFDNLASLENIQITGDTTKYKSIDGILFYEDGSNSKTIIRYPRNKSGSSYTIPNDTYYIGPYAFRGCDNLQSVTLPSNCKIEMAAEVFADPFMDCKNLSKFVTYGNKNEGFFTDENGVLYRSYDGYATVLYHCPMNANIKTFTLNKNVTYVAVRSINNSNIETLILSTVVNGFGQPYCNMPNVKKVIFSSDFIAACNKYGSSYINYIYSFAGSAVNGLGSKNVANVSVETANSYIKVVDNVLYSADMKTILAYPPAIRQSVFVLPTSVNAIGDLAFGYLNSSDEELSMLKHNTVMHISAEQLELFKDYGLGTFNAVCVNVSQQKINEANTRRSEQLELCRNLFQHLASGEELSGDESLLYFTLTYAASFYGYSDITDYINYIEQSYDFEFKVCSGHGGESDNIIKTASTQTVDYRSIVTVTATATDVPDGYKLAIYLGSQKVSEGDNKSVSYEYGELKSDLNYTVKVVDASGKVQKDSNGNDLTKDGTVKCNTGFFKKIIAFFRGLFKSLPKVEVKP